MHRTSSDSAVYGGGLQKYSRHRGGYETSGKLLTQLGQRKFTTGQPLHHPVYRLAQGDRFSLGFLPTQIEEALSRREELLGSPYPGTPTHASPGNTDNKPTATETSQSGEHQGTQRGIKIEIPVQPDQENLEGYQEIAMAANNVQGGQLSAIPMFSGTRGLDTLTYADAIDGTIPQFGMTQPQAAQAAATRGGPAVANWLRGERAAGTVYNSWSDNAGNSIPMRPAFIQRFGPVYTTSGAVSAISDLKKRSGENVASFMDRVKVAVSMLHYNVAEAD